MKATSKASWPDVGYRGGRPGRGQVEEHWRGCLAARAMVHILSSTVSAPGVGWVEEHQRGVCGSEGDGAHAVEHGECAGGDVWLQGGCGVGVCSGRGRGRTRELRGEWWQYGEGGGGGTERAAAVGCRG